MRCVGGGDEFMFSTVTIKYCSPSRDAKCGPGSLTSTSPEPGSEDEE